MLWTVGAVASLLPVTTPALALAGGATLGLSLGDPFEGGSRRASSMLLKAAVVGLGFGLSLPAVVATGRSGFTTMALAIATALMLGHTLGRWLRVDRDTSTLISGGTAICGGSAIAAIAPAIGAGTAATGVAMATIFLLNGVALYLFPYIGHLVGLSQSQFATWAAIAIHDTSSVVGASAQYGPAALELATVLKLTRALWIVPLAAGIALVRGRRSRGGRAVVPWFIGLFVAASTARTLQPGSVHVFDALAAAAGRLLVLSLFLIGAGITRTTLRSIGMRPLLQGAALWLCLAAGALAAVYWAPQLPR